MKTEGLRNNITPILAILMVFLCFGVLYIALYVLGPANELKTTIVNGCLAILMILANYFFGSSKSMSDRMKSENPTEIVSKETVISQTQNKEK